MTKGGDELHLTKTEFRLLCELSDSGKVMTREQTARASLGLRLLRDGRLVDVHVRRLRLKIEDDPASPRYVATAAAWATSCDPDMSCGGRAPCGGCCARWRHPLAGR